MDGLNLSDIAAVTGNEKDSFGGWTGLIALLIIASIFTGGGGVFGSGAARTEDIQRAVDLNSIQQGQANIAADIQRGIYEINGATKDAAYNNLSEIRDVQAGVATGFANIINNLTGGFADMQKCCCETQRAIDGVNYNIATTSAANTQKVLDAIAGNRMADMQSQINNLQLQNALNGVIRYPSASTYSAGFAPWYGAGTTF